MPHIQRNLGLWRRKDWRCTRCTRLPNIQARYQVSSMLENNAEENAFPVCINHNVSGCDPASGYSKGSKCCNILEFDDTTGDWNIRDIQLASRNWTAKVQGKQVNKHFTLLEHHYRWRKTLDGLLYMIH